MIRVTFSTQDKGTCEKNYEASTKWRINGGGWVEIVREDDVIEASFRADVVLSVELLDMPLGTDKKRK